MCYFNTGQLVTSKTHSVLCKWFRLERAGKVEDWDCKSYVFALPGHSINILFTSLWAQEKPEASSVSLAQRGLCFCGIRVLNAMSECEDGETGASASAVRIPQKLGVSAYLGCGLGKTSFRVADLWGLQWKCRSQWYTDTLLGWGSYLQEFKDWHSRFQITILKL